MNPYSTIKLLHHPRAIECIREGLHQNPTQIHFMPMLACNQHCTFCSYGHRVPEDGPEQRGWKNMQLMSDAFMPFDKMMECLRDWVEMGVKAIEITGGGEPLLHPQIDQFITALADTEIDVGLVTNGTPLTPGRASLLQRCRWKWVRVSIDAGSPESYAKTRRVKDLQWFRAWQAVQLMSERRSYDDQLVGVGFVVDIHNWEEVYAACVKAKACGAQNIRVSFAFTPQGVMRLPEGAASEVEAQLEAAKAELQDEGFKVVDLFSERLRNVLAGKQGYRMCGVKEVMAVVGGDCNVYTCCTLAFNRKGLIGSIRNQSFKQLWWSPETLKFFKNHDARRVCNVPCLYERRNKAILNMLRRPPEQLAEMRARDKPIHTNFI